MLSKRPPRVLRFRTGGWFERWFMFPALCLLSVLLIPGVWPVVYPYLTDGAQALWATATRS